MLSRHRIRFKDCDPLGHLYNTRFLDYMLEAREDHILEHHKIDLEKYAVEQGLAWVVVNHEISYIKEAKRNEFVKIKTALIHFNEKTIVNEYQMWNDDMTHLKSLMWTTFVHIDLRQKKAIAHNEEIMNQLSSMIEKINENNIKERIKKLML
ncbi:MAG: acyl-CoA thioesterase [Saprospiraceae bacterium]|nr:acyl-CoA thioesterase [Saprospiraceae bacterium]